MTREIDLRNAIMQLIRDDLHATFINDYTTLTDIATFRLVREIMRDASRELTAALDFDHMSDSVYDEIRNPIYVLNAAREIMEQMFDTVDVRYALPAIDELIDTVLINIDDMIDDDNRLPTSVDELIQLFAND